MAALDRRQDAAGGFDPWVLDRLGVPVTRLATDSRRVRAGDVFVALPGGAHDGRTHIGEAIAAGAAAVLWEPAGFAWDPAWSVPNLAVPELRRNVGDIASHVYGHASSRLWVTGVTGTNGKTSCSHWLAHCLPRCAVIGTLGIGFPGALAPSPHTTPDAVSVHEALAEFLAAGAQAVAMEVSSHGLEQGRVDAVEFDAAVFTNLSREHLDYHGDMGAYAAAKARLFHRPELQFAIVNLDDRFGVELAVGLRREGLTVIGYGLDHPAGYVPGTVLRVRGEGLKLTGQGITMRASTPWGGADLSGALLGRFNASNLLAVLAAACAAGMTPEAAAQALASVQPVAGRTQRLGGGERPLVVVDYAHTPDALEKVLTALRELLPGAGARLICVFGCGGERDRGKRPLMGEIATRLADEAVITSDNPRREDPQAIIADIVEGAGPNHRVIVERAEAIHHAVSGARAGDVVLLAGKGHEAWQEVAGRRLPFDDSEVARKLLDGWGS